MRIKSLARGSNGISGGNNGSIGSSITGSNNGISGGSNGSRSSGISGGNHGSIGSSISGGSNESSVSIISSGDSKSSVCGISDGNNDISQSEIFLSWMCDTCVHLFFPPHPADGKRIWWFFYTRLTVTSITYLSVFEIYIVCILVISECSSPTKFKLSKSTKRNAWLSLRDTSPWRATNSEECDVVWRDRYFCFLALLASLLLTPLCTIIEQGDTTQTMVDSSEPSEAVKE